MKCSNCKIDIAKKYSFAIKNNQCPACGKHIMQPEKLAAYTRLQELVKNNFSGVDCEKLANLVVANFELKQLFKEGNLNEDTESEVVVTEVQEDEIDYVAPVIESVMEGAVTLRVPTPVDPKVGYKWNALEEYHG